MTSTLEHGSEHAHHEDPRTVYLRQRLGVLIFIAGDLVTFGALIFTYLYLRGTNTLGHWMSIVAVPNTAATKADPQGFLDNGGQMSLIHEHALSAGLSWIIAAVVVLSALFIWWGERRLKAGAKGAMTLAGILATLSVMVSIGLTVAQMHSVPQYWRAEADSQLYVYTAYGSVMLALGISALLHALVLLLLGSGVIRRSVSGRLSPEAPYHATLVRLFWVWVAISTVLTTVVVTVFTNVN